MGLEPGKKLGPYEIVSPLGAGGMGEVYRARDTRLDRDVAVKVLPAHLANDPQLKQRFEREARTVSSLNHPHICTLYDIGREGSTDFLVMEYLEGETLQKRLERGPLEGEQLFRMAIEVSDALDKAHRKGVIHRDLKPGNIMLTPAGAKVLDFGLAKTAAPLVPGSSSSGKAAPAGAADAMTAGATAAGATASPTMSSPLTTAGSVVGTYQYMSPEQLEGREADARSDIFSLGAVIYEMATARRAFAGKSRYSVASAILEKDPDPIRSIAPEAPAALERVVSRCLAKDPEDRWQTARDVTVELQWASEHSSDAPASSPAVETAKTSPLRRLLPWSMAGLAVAIAAVFAVIYFTRSPAAVSPIRSLISPPEKGSFAFNGPEGVPVLSPDGTRLVFPATDASGKQALWLRPLDSLTAERLEGTEDASFPFWAPDSRHLGFFQQDKLKKIDVTGGPPVTLCDAPGGRGGAWSRNDVIVFAPQILSGGLSSVPSAGGSPTTLASHKTSEGASSNRWPVFLPDGSHFLYLSGDLSAAGTSKLGIYVGELGTDEAKFLLQSDSDALYAAPGYLLFLRGSTLMAQPFDAGSQELKGEAFPVAENVGSPQLFRLGVFTVSQTGLLLYSAGGSGSGGGQLVWLDASGKQLGTVGKPGSGDLMLSPDGRRLAYVRSDSGGKHPDIWLMDLRRSVETRFTFGPLLNRFPVWSPDGARIAYTSPQNGQFNLFVKDTSGAGSGEPLLQSDAQKFASDWSRDGRYLLYTAVSPQGKSQGDLWALPLFGDRKPFPYLQTQFNEGFGVFSPDVHWVAYESNESGSFEIYLSPFPKGGGKYQVSQGGGVQPHWSREGSEIYYLAPGGKLMEASIKEKVSGVEIGTLRQLFQMPMANTGPAGHAYSVAPDGKRFLVAKEVQGASLPLTLVTDWTAGLKK
jgi:serine/threonine protein kinase